MAVSWLSAPATSGVRDDIAEFELGLNMGEPHLRLHRPENSQFQAHGVLLCGLGIEVNGDIRC